MKKIKIKPFNIVNGFIMVFLGLIFLLPFWFMITASFSDNTYLIKNGVSLLFHGFNFEGYRLLFNASETFFRSILNSIIVSFGTALLSVIVCTSGAYVLSRKDLVGRKWFTLYFTIPMFFGGGMVPLFIIIKALNLYDSIWAFILPSVVSIYNIVLVRNYFYSLPSSLSEASDLDGASEFQKLIYVYVPLALPMMFSIFMLTFVAKWNNWMDSLLYLSGTNEMGRTLQYELRLILYDVRVYLGEDGVNAPIVTIENAAIVISVLPLILLSPVMTKFFGNGLMIGSVKG